jgi:nitroreductase
MVRRTTAEPVDPAALQRILDTARRGPSAGFSQGQSFVVVTEAERRQQIAVICGEPAYLARGFEPWISRAPVLIVPCVERQAYIDRYDEPDKTASRKPSDWDVPFWWVDGGAALMLLLLAAVDEGLAAGFLAVESTALREALGIPTDVEPIGVLTVGHGADDRRSGSVARGRRPLGDVVHREAWAASPGSQRAAEVGGAPSGRPVPGPSA